MDFFVFKVLFWHSFLILLLKLNNYNMKNLILTGIVGAVFAVSCSTAKIAQENHKEFMKLKGDWEITSVDYSNQFKVKPFGEGADVQCWIGSHWKLIPNNFSGTYTLNGGGNCPEITQPIKFEVVDGNVFQFKKIADGTKAKQNVQGYTLTLINQATDQFSLQQTVPYDGENVNVVYNFQRTASK